MKSVIKSCGALTILAATSMPFSAAQANCTTIQKLVNDGTLEPSFLMQIGGDQKTIQQILMNQALCRELTQRLINNGILTRTDTTDTSQIGVDPLVISAD